jgi:hypothetical protein
MGWCENLIAQNPRARTAAAKIPMPFFMSATGRFQLEKRRKLLGLGYFEPFRRK